MIAQNLDFDFGYSLEPPRKVRVYPQSEFEQYECIPLITQILHGRNSIINTLFMIYRLTKYLSVNKILKVDPTGESNCLQSGKLSCFCTQGTSTSEKARGFPSHTVDNAVKEAEIKCTVNTGL